MRDSKPIARRPLRPEYKVVVAVFTRQTDFDLAALHHALDAQRQARGITWEKLVREINRNRASGVHPIARSTVAGLPTKAVAEGDGILQMLRWLNRSPESFVPG